MNAEHPCTECPYRKENVCKNITFVNRGVCHMSNRRQRKKTNTDHAKRELPCRGHAHFHKTGEHWESKRGSRRGMNRMFVRADERAAKERR